MFCPKCGRAAILALAPLIATAACARGPSGSSEARPLPVGASSPDRVPRSAVTPRETGAARAEAGACDEDDMVWDVEAHECRMYPDGPYGWTGCSLATSPPAGFRCVTGAHWSSCTCECNDGLRFDRKLNVCQ